VKALTETFRFTSSDDLKSWLEDQTSSTLMPVHTQAKKLRDEMHLAIQAIIEVSKILFDNSNREIEKRNMKVYNRARALNKLAHLFLERLKKINPSEEITYDSLNRYAQEVQKVLLVTEVDIRNWFPRISPFFIMDRRKFLTVFEKAKQLYSALNDFITKEYIKTKTLEETFLLIDELQGIENQLSTIKEEKEDIKDERIPIEQEINELEEKIEELQSKGPIDKLNLVNMEIESLSNELKYAIRHLQKPFIKVQALSIQGGGAGLIPGELDKLNEYLQDPFNAFVSEKSGYPILKEILQKIEILLSEDKLKLKSDKARKAQQSIDDILKRSSLDKLQIRCVEMATNKEQLIASSKMDEIKRDLATIQDQVDLLKARKSSVEINEVVKVNAYKDTMDKMSNLKRTIEKNINNSVGVKVQLS
jgi:hypothetical protein